MGDMTIHAYRWCQENTRFLHKVLGSTGNTYYVLYSKTPHGPYQYGWSCSCPAFKFRKTCKHIDECKPMRCTTGSGAASGSPTEMGKKCPDCGGPTSVIQVAV